MDEIVHELARNHLKKREIISSGMPKQKDDSSFYRLKLYHIEKTHHLFYF